MIVGTAGHIDHGKTALVKALTGVDTDRLPEERARGITLDLGYAYTDDGLLGYVDMPGHEKLVRNMLAGATGIDFLLLIVAADDGPMPQTREHLAIADLLGLGCGAVVLTKTDIASPERQQTVLREIAALLAGTALERAPVFRVAATRGDGIAALRDHLLAAARDRGERKAAGAFRLAVDRAFNLNGVGLVVTGTAFAGTVAVGDSVMVTPPGLPARVRGLHVNGRRATAGCAGQRIALNLAGSIGKADVARGMWIVAPPLHLPVQRCHCRVRALAPLRHWQQLHLHHGAGDTTARLALLEGDALPAGESMLAELILAMPMGALVHDRFILRDPSANQTLGGGQVLDVFPPTRRKRAPGHLALLRLCEDADPAVALDAMLNQQPAGVDLGRFALGRNLDDIAALVQILGIRRIGAAGFTAGGWQHLTERLLAALDAEHARTADLIGVDRDRLRRLTLPTLAREVFDQLVGELLAGGRVTQTGGWLHLPAHRATLPSADVELWRQLLPLLAATPFQPPRVRDVARATGIAEERVRGLMKRVARVGLAYPVAHDHYFTAHAVADLAARVDALCERDGAARAAALRDAVGGGRKVAVQILEFFDRVSYTRRVRDVHVRRDTTAARQWVLQ